MKLSIKHSALCLIVIASLLSSQPKAYAQDFSSDISRWFSGSESLELKRALGKLSELIELFTSAEKTSEENIAVTNEHLPEELRSLIEDSSDFDRRERAHALLFGSEQELGLLEAGQQLNISEYNKLVLIGALIYRENPASRPVLSQWMQQMQALHEQRQQQENHSPGYMITEGAFTAVSIVLIARTAVLVGKSGFIQKSLQRLRPAAQGVPLMGGAAAGTQLISVTPTTMLERLKAFLQTRNGIIALHGGAAALGGAYGGVQSYLYTLQTQRVSPDQTLKLIQADLACELAYGASDLRAALKARPPSSWQELSETNSLLTAAEMLNSELSQAFPQLVNLWTNQTSSWSQIREQFEKELSTESSQVNCSQISTDVIGMDLAFTRQTVQAQIRMELLNFDALDSAELIENHRQLLKDNSAWLSLQDDLIRSQPWIPPLLRQFQAEAMFEEWF